MKCSSVMTEPRKDLVSNAPAVDRSTALHQYRPRIEHAGVITHPCVLEDEHEWCQCRCGEKWRKHAARS